MNDIYPELTEEGKTEAQRVMDRVLENAKRVAVSVLESELDGFYYHIAEHVESDSWNNYINEILFEEYRDEIINDIIIDLESKI